METSFHKNNTLVLYLGRVWCSELEQEIYVCLAFCIRFPCNVSVSWVKMMPKTKGETVSRKNVRIPEPLMDEVDATVQECRMYINRQQFIESAIREKVEKFKFMKIREMTANPRSEPTGSALLQEVDENLLIHVKEIFLVHSIISIVKGKTMPANHPDQKKLEGFIKRYMMERAEKTGKKITRKQLEEITKDLLEYHKEILEGLSLMTSH